MEPGNKLNAWVAWKVMGYSATDTSFNPHKGELYIRKLVKNENLGKLPNGVAIVEFAYMEMLPEFSENITAAWEVYEWLVERHEDATLTYPWSISADYDPMRETTWSIHAEGKSAPEAICKAALLAVLDI